MLYALIPCNAIIACLFFKLRWTFIPSPCLSSKTFCYHHPFHKNRNLSCFMVSFNPIINSGLIRAKCQTHWEDRCTFSFQGQLGEKSTRHIMQKLVQKIWKLIWLFIEIHKQSPMFLLLTRNFLLVISCKYGHFSSFLDSLS